MSDADALQQVRAIAPRREADVARDGQVWEQPVVLGDVADAALLRREVPAALGIEPRFRRESDVTVGRALESGDGA